MFIGPCGLRSVPLELRIEGREVAVPLAECGQFPFSIQAAVWVSKGILQNRKQVFQVIQGDSVGPDVRMDLVIGEAREERNGIAKAGLGFTDRGGVQTDLSQEFSE